MAYSRTVQFQTVSNWIVRVSYSLLPIYFVGLILFKMLAHRVCLRQMCSTFCHILYRNTDSFGWGCGVGVGVGGWGGGGWGMTVKHNAAHSSTFTILPGSNLSYSSSSLPVHLHGTVALRRKYKIFYFKVR